MELSIDRVFKQYKNKIAVDRISLKLHKGVYGLLGANGAGKTTLMRMICGILTPTSGTISFDGIDVSEENYRAILGYLPQDFGYYPEFTGQNFLLYMAALKGLTKPQAKRKAAELLRLVSLQDVAKKKIQTYSGGMKQRLGIAQALLNQPKLIILDEPTAGLDPKERVRFRNLIADLGKDSIVLLSTHIVSDIEHIADNVLIMKDGQLIYQNKWEESFCTPFLGNYYINGQLVDTNYNMYLVDKAYSSELSGREIDQALLEETISAYRKVPTNVEPYSLTEEYQQYARPYSAIFNFIVQTTPMQVSDVRFTWQPGENDLYMQRQSFLTTLMEGKYLPDGEI